MKYFKRQDLTVCHVQDMTQYILKTKSSKVYSLATGNLNYESAKETYLERHLKTLKCLDFKPA